MATIISSHKSAKKERKKRNQEKITEETFEMRKPIKFDIQKVETIVRALCLAGIRFYRTSSSFILPPTRFYTIQIAQGGKEDEEKNTLAHQESQRNCNWIFIFKLGTFF
jgi:hypothetical protein